MREGGRMQRSRSVAVVHANPAFPLQRRASCKPSCQTGKPLSWVDLEESASMNKRSFSLYAGSNLSPETNTPVLPFSSPSEHDNLLSVISMSAPSSGGRDNANEAVTKNTSQHDESENLLPGSCADQTKFRFATNSGDPTINLEPATRDHSKKRFSSVSAAQSAQFGARRKLDSVTSGSLPSRVEENPRFKRMLRTRLRVRKSLNNRTSSVENPRQQLLISDAPVNARRTLDASPLSAFRAGGVPLPKLIVPRKNSFAGSMPLPNPPDKDEVLTGSPDTAVARPHLQLKSGQEIMVKDGRSSTVLFKIFVQEAVALERSKFFGLSDPYCAVQVEGQWQRTRVIASTQNPVWQDGFDFEISSLTSPAALHVIDKHGTEDARQIGSVEFVPLELMLRAGWARDSNSFSADAWFVLQNGAAVAGNIRVQLRIERCQASTHFLSASQGSKIVLEEFAREVTRTDEVGTSGMELPDQSKLASCAVRAELAELEDLEILFDGQQSLDEGCEDGYYSMVSCGVWHRDSALRRYAFALVTSNAFQALSWLASVGACGAVIVETGPASLTASPLATMEFASYVFLALEMALKTIAFGFVHKAGSFLSGSAFNMIDLVAAVSYWIEFVLPEPQEFTLRPIRCFRVLRPLTHFQAFTSFTAIILTLKAGFVKLAVVSSLFFLCCVVFGIFAVTFYSDSLSWRCVNASTGELIFPRQWCKMYDNGGSNCGPEQTCAHLGNINVLHFDEMGSALVSIFVAVSLDGQEDMMNRAVQSEPHYRLFGVAFFVFLNFFCRILLFNLCAAVVTTTFHTVRERVLAALKSVQHRDADLSVSGSTPLFARPSPTSNPAHLHGSGRRTAQVSLHDQVFKVVSHPGFEVVSMCVILVNVVALALNSAAVTEEYAMLLATVGVVTDVFFVVELLLRMAGANNLSEFFSHGHDVFDFFVILITAMSLFAQTLGITRDELGLLASLSALRCLRLVSCVPEINYLLTLCLANATNLVNLLFFTFSFLSVMAVCAKFFFSARKAAGDPAYDDFSSYWTAMDTLFEVLSSDLWRFVLLRAMEHGLDTADSWRVVMPAFLLISFNFICQAVILNLFIAVIVENFGLATISERKRQLEQGEEDGRDIYDVLRGMWRWLRSGLRSISRRIAAVVPVSMHKLSRVQAEGAKSVEPDDWALGLFRKSHPARRVCKRVAESQMFSAFIMAVILTSMIALAIEPPARDETPKVPYEVLDAINFFSVVVFAVEFVVQVMHLGFCLGPNSYLRSPWNAADFVVLILSIMDLFFGDTKQARLLRIGRALRPLRLIKRSPDMRIMVDALLSMWRPVLMIIALAVTVAAIFSILAMTLFKGRMASCSDDALVFPEGKMECSGLSMQGNDWIAPRAWLVPPQNFDSFSNSMIQMLSMNTFKWVELKRLVTSITEPDKMPVEGYRPSYGIFFVVYVVIGCLFVMNLFVVFIIDGFQQLRKADFQHLSVVHHYQNFFHLVRKFSPHRMHPHPTHPVRVWIRHNVVKTQWFGFLSSSCVIVNVFFLALYSPKLSSDGFKRIYDLQNTVFLALLLLEVVLQTLAVGFLSFIGNGWNWVDLASIVSSLLAYSYPQSTILRGTRIAKVFRLVKNIRALKAIIVTLAQSIPQFLSVMLLLFIMFSIYAVLLTNVAGLVRQGQLKLGSPNARWPSENPTFVSYSVSMYTLFLITQGDDWHLMIYDAAVQPPFCTPKFEGKEYGDCGVPLVLSTLVFLSFKVVAEYVLLNLFIGMIIDTFSGSHQADVQFHIERGREQRVGQILGRRRVSALRGSISSQDETEEAMCTPSCKGEADSLEKLKGRSRSHLRPDSKSCVECWNAMTGGGRHSFMMIDDVHVLLRKLPPPLGFARNAFGEPEIGARERAQIRMVCAELSVVALERGLEESEAFGLLTGLRRWLGLLPPFPREVQLVTFEEVMITLLHWRCPQLVPSEVKEAREQKMDEVVRTAHLRVICRVVKRWLEATKPRREAKRAQQGLQNRLPHPLRVEGGEGGGQHFWERIRSEGGDTQELPSTARLFYGSMASHTAVQDGMVSRTRDLANMLNRTHERHATVSSTTLALQFAINAKIRLRRRRAAAQSTVPSV